MLQVLAMDRFGIRGIMKNNISLPERITGLVEEVFDLGMDQTEHRIVGFIDIAC